MNKPYGFAASVTPSTEFHEEQPIVLDRIEISVHAGHLEVGYDHEEDEHMARRMAPILVDAWRARTRVALEVGFDQARNLEAQLSRWKGYGYTAFGPSHRD